jgi:hypothetical protein
MQIHISQVLVIETTLQMLLELNYQDMYTSYFLEQRTKAY